MNEKKTKLEELGYELNVLTTNKNKLEKHMRGMKKELSRIQDKIDEISKELIAHLNNMTKPK